MKLSTMQYRGYTAKITNLSTNEEIQDWVQECNITLPNSSFISSLEARFQLDEKKLNKDNEVKIEIFDEVGNILYTLQGKTSIPKRTKSYTGTEVWEYSIKDSYDKLFDRVVPENMTFYDLYMCNTKDIENSLLHKIARALGFQDEDMDFSDCAFDNGELIRVPFVHLEEKSRWIDKLQAFKEASDGILYANNKKLFFRPRNLAIESGFDFNRTNIIAKIEESEKEVLQNGIKVIYDRYEKLENQVVFNLQKKVITDPNLTLDKIPTMRITYITSAVSNPTLTKATGYYFTTEDPNSKVEVLLEKDVHYKIESFKETMAEIKFLNPYAHKLYVDNFEIKGVPLSMYEDNEVNVMFKNVKEKHQENFIIKSKNKMVQTSKQSEFLAKKFMRREVVNTREYRFKTHFLHQIKVGGVYSLELEDIETIIEVKSININLKTSQFTMDIQAECVEKELREIKLTTKTAATPKGNYVDLKPLEDKVKKAESKVKLLEQDIRSTLHRMEQQPTENVKENDVWLNPKTNVWKKYYNNTWNPISEAEILPSMKLYNSIETNIIKFQNTADRVGAYLLNDGEKFGSLNGELAHVTFDKMGQFEAENPNNRVAMNIKDPANPSRVTSQILLGVTDVKDPKWKDTVFAIGDEASPNRIEFKNGQMKQIVNGKELSKRLGEVDKNINVLQSDLEKQITFEVGGDADKYYPVFFTATKKLCRFIIYRNYDEKAPATWNTATHMGALQLEMTTNFGSDWDGDPNEIVVHKFKEQYATVASKIHIPHLYGTLVWLRGGGAVYHAYCDDITVNKTLQAQVLLQGYDNPARDKKYPETEIGKAGTYTETGSASTIKALSANEKIKQTQQDITSYKTETSASIDTVKGALEQGDFTITGRTVFDGSARFLSRGTNEVITIANGAIDFHRDGKRLTRIKNIRYGTVSTDSKGKGVVNFEGFKQPMIVMSSIKSANFGKNMASVFCYTSLVSGTQYQFYVGGTNEYWVEATPIRTAGLTWSANNAMSTDFISVEINIRGHSSPGIHHSLYKRQSNDFSLKSPPQLKLVLTIYENGAKRNLTEKIIDIQGCYMAKNTNNTNFHMPSGIQKIYIPIPKVYSSRTNIKYELTITTHKNTAEYNFHVFGRNHHYVYQMPAGYQYYTTTFLTASASTSTLGGVTGNGEVSYIAMEID